MIRCRKLAAAAVTLPLALAACTGAERAQAEEAAASSAATVETVTPDALSAMVEAGGALLVDVREPDEFAEGHLAGAINLPLSSFDPASVPQVAGRETILYCRSSRRSGEAAERLSQERNGTVRHLEGGILAWEEAGFATVTDPAPEG